MLRYKYLNKDKEVDASKVFTDRLPAKKLRLCGFL